jgi:thiol-disulfide isomerase/thioredoxin
VDVVKFGPLVLSVPVLLVLAAFLTANGVAAFHRRRHGSQADAGPVIWNMMLFGALASRAVFVLRHHDIYLAKPLSALDIRDGGFDAGAGLIVACVAAALATRRHAALRRPAMAAVLAGCAVWFGGTLLAQLHAPPDAPLPEIAVRRLDGVEVPLRSYIGKPMVLNLWATWCPPCRREMPVLQAAQRAHPGVAFVFVNQGESAETVARFMAQQELRMANVLLDPAARTAARTGSPGYPATLFYDARGVLRLRHTGELSEATLREKLRALEP